MKIKLLRQILRMTKYALVGVYIQCLCAGVLWASDSNAQQQSISDTGRYVLREIDVGQSRQQGWRMDMSMVGAIVR